MLGPQNIFTAQLGVIMNNIYVTDTACLTQRDQLYCNLQQRFIVTIQCHISFLLVMSDTKS